MSTTSAVFRIALVLAAFTSVALAAQSDQPERVVIISLTGDWKLDGTTVVFGQRLLAQGCLFGSDGSVVLQPDKKAPRPSPSSAKNPRAIRPAPVTRARVALCPSIRAIGKHPAVAWATFGTLSRVSLPASLKNTWSPPAAE